jgi:hypothetical protein
VKEYVAVGVEVKVLVNVGVLVAVNVGVEANTLFNAPVTGPPVTMATCPVPCPTA